MGIRFRPRAVPLALAGVVAALAAADHLFPPDLSRARDLSSEVRDREGGLLRPFLARDGNWRLSTRVDDVNPRYLSIVKVYEDQRFDSHFGIDPGAAGRALYQNLIAGHVVSGASTLTMQVARLLHPSKKRGLATKLVQSLRAVQLELRYSKKEILELYLTLAPFGGNIEGVRAASLSYFGKEPKSLTLAEAALLVALPQSPERARPDRNSEAATMAREKVLARLKARGWLAADEAGEIRNTPVPLRRFPMPLNAPQLAERLASQSATGVVIDTTIDGRMQKSIERLASSQVEFLVDGATTAAIVVDTRTREVLAELGGTDYWGPGGQIDLASSLRSPGSALKPLIYGPPCANLPLHP